MKKRKMWFMWLLAMMMLAGPFAGDKVYAKEEVDEIAPVLTGLERIEKGPFGTESTITYQIQFLEENSGMGKIEALFISGDDNEEHFVYEQNSDDPVSDMKSIEIASSKREEGKYRLVYLTLEDRAGNCMIYQYDEEHKAYVYHNLTTGAEGVLKIDGDFTYLVEAEHVCKWEKETVITPASFEADGLLKKVCTRCEEEVTEAIPRVKKVVLSTSLYTYDGKVKKPTVTLKDAAGNTVSTTHYFVDYASGRKYAGEYKVTITLRNKYKGKYKGTGFTTFAIQPKAPTSVKASLTAYNEVKVTWKKATGADDYNVYYKTPDSDYVRYEGEKTSTSCTISELMAGVKYTFKVVPCYKAGEKLVESEKFATVSHTTLKKVEITGIESASSKKVRVRWNNVANETGYEIARIDENGKQTITTYKTTSGASKQISATAGKEYQYKVRAYKIVGKTKIKGEWSDTVTFTLRNIKAVTDAKAELFENNNKIKVTWKNASGATGYQVYCKAEDGEYEKLLYTEDTQYLAEEVDAGVKYTFKIQPCYMENEEILSTGTSDTATVTTLRRVANVEVSRYSDTKVTVKWTNIREESGYEIAQSTSESEADIIAITSYATTSGKSKKVTLAELPENESCYFMVRAYKNVNGSKIYGPWSKIVKYEIN